ncbi:MAG: thioesterase domain-containing protein [Xanthobacteraceae bacterium]
MRRGFHFVAIGMLSAVIALAAGLRPGMAQPRAHVYLFRGLADVFSTGMDTLAQELNKRGVYATSHNHADWQTLADKAAADYKAKKEGPIILVGHSLGADAVMEMADYLGDKGVPVALVIPFDGTQSFPAPGNVSRVINFTQRDYAYMRPGLGFRGSLSNVDLSADHDINHLNIDKSPELHARVIKEVLAIVGGRRMTAPALTTPASTGAPERNPSHAPANVGEAEAGGEPKSSAAPAASPRLRKPALPPQSVNPELIPN